jgi:hypothetical protein
VIKVINGITEQANLQALNAAIEAASSSVQAAAWGKEFMLLATPLEGLVSQFLLAGKAKTVAATPERDEVELSLSANGNPFFLASIEIPDCV